MTRVIIGVGLMLLGLIIFVVAIGAYFNAFESVKASTTSTIVDDVLNTTKNIFVDIVSAIIGVLIFGFGALVLRSAADE